MKVLDLYCGAGGSAVGYSRVGFEVYGVDHKEQKHYPFNYMKYDALEFLQNWFFEEWPEEYRYTFEHFDLIHASPPCQRFSALQKRTGRDYPDLIKQTRELLIATGKPYVIENIPQAPLIDPTILCGSMFNLGAGEYQLRRHRHFETNFSVTQPECAHKGYAIGVHGGGAWNNKDRPGGRGCYKGSAEECRIAMDIDWMNRDEITQAVPPAYTEYIGKEFIKWNSGRS